MKPDKKSDDWHPVDEKKMNKRFIREILESAKGRSRKVTIDELFK